MPAPTSSKSSGAKWYGSLPFAGNHSNVRRRRTEQVAAHVLAQNGSVDQLGGVVRHFHMCGGIRHGRAYGPFARRSAASDFEWNI